MGSDLVDLRRDLRARLMARVGYLLDKPNLALAAAALHPAYGHLAFVPLHVRDMIWEELGVWVVGDANGEGAFPRPKPKQTRRQSGPIVVDTPPSQRAVKEELKKLRDTFEGHKPENCLTEMRDEIDALQWYKNNQDAFPAIKHLPFIIFSVPGTSAAAERQFSCSSANASILRSRLDVDKMEMLSLVRSVIKQMGVDGWKKWINERVDQHKDKKRQQP